MQSGNLPQLTFTRFAAAVAVVIFHYGQSAVPFDAGFRHEIASEAGITVSYFFFLSGFVLYHVYGNREFHGRSYFIARVARILPLYWFAFALTLFGILVLLQQKPWGGTAILQALFVQAWFPGNALTINYPSWSVSVEVFFYCMFPLLLMLVKKKGENRFVVFAVILWLISIVQNYFTQQLCYDPDSSAAGDFIMYFPLWHLNAFVAGMAVYILYQRLKERRTWKLLPLIVAISGVALVIAIITSEGIFYQVKNTGFLSPFYAMIVIGLALDRTVVSQFLALKPLQFLGEISYGIYLLQYPVWIGFAYFAPGIEVKSTTGFYLYLAVLIAFSALIYQILEKPLRILIRSRFARNSTDPA